MKKLQINIFTTELEWIGTIDNVESLIHRTSWHEIINSEITVSKSAQSVEHLQIGNILIVNNQLNRPLIIEDLSTSLDDNHITFNLIPMKAMLNYRICHPTDSLSYVSKTQAEIMKLLIWNNLIANTRDKDRKFLKKDGATFIGVAGIQPMGKLMDFTVDWETGYLGDTISEISKMYGSTEKYPLGWNIYIKESYQGCEMEVYQGKEKHINQTINPPVVFSEEFGNIKNVSYEYSIKDWRNVIFMTYENVDGVPSTLSVGNTTYGATVGFNRKEIIADSSKEDGDEVANEGHAELNKRPQVESFSAEIINNTNTLSTYKEDWDIGDIVTIQSKKVLPNKIISVDAQITEIEEIYSDGEYSINATFGEGKLSIFDLIKQSIK